MATHSYTVISIERIGDIATVFGTVDGVNVSAITSWTLITQQPSATAFENLVSPLLLAASITLLPVVDHTHNGSWTQ